MPEKGVRVTPERLQFPSYVYVVLWMRCVQTFRGPGNACLRETRLLEKAVLGSGFSAHSFS